MGTRLHGGPGGRPWCNIRKGGTGAPCPQHPVLSWGTQGHWLLLGPSRQSWAPDLFPVQCPVVSAGFQTWCVGTAGLKTCEEWGPGLMEEGTRAACLRAGGYSLGAHWVTSPNRHTGDTSYSPGTRSAAGAPLQGDPSPPLPSPPILERSGGGPWRHQC